MEPAKTTLVVLAAGLGSRYGGMKQLEPVGPAGESILEYSLFDARRAGFSEAVFIIRKEMEADFRRLLDRIGSGLNIRLAYQETDCLPSNLALAPALQERAAHRIKPWGTGHALWCARQIVDSPFAVINADDYYGPRSFTLIQDFLATVPADSATYAMVAFELGKTLSDYGPVARGICGVSGKGLLTQIVEHTRLQAVTEEGGSARVTAGNSRIASTGIDGTRVFYPRDTPVSMNLFGFTPRLLPQLEGLFRDFLATSAGDQEVEFYLPAAVQSLVGKEEATVRVLQSPETWLGLTYRDDTEVVRKGLLRLTADGVYPATLRTAD